MREYICVWFSSLEEYAGLSDDEFGSLIRAGLEYAKDGTEPALNGAMRFVWPSMRHKIDKDVKHYQEVCEKRREAGAKGGVAKATNCYQLQANDSKTEQSLAKTDNRNSNRNSNSNTNSDNNKRFKRPTDEDVYAYFVAQGWPYTEAGAFYDYYESNGWRVGRNPMKDWQAAARNWVKRSKERNTPKPGTQAYKQRQLLESIQRDSVEGWLLE